MSETKTKAQDQFSEKFLEVVIPRIIEFLDQLILLERECSPMKLFKGVCERCLNKDKKAGVKPEKIIIAFRSFADHCLPFLENTSALRMLSKDFKITYIPGKIFVPLGQITKKADPENREAIRSHLLTICKLVAGPETDTEKLSTLLKIALPSPSDGNDDDGDDIEIDEMDKSFLGPLLAKMPGVDPKMLYKVGKQTFGNIDATEMEPEELQQTLLDGIGTMLEAPFFKNVLANMGKIAKSDSATPGDEMAQFTEMMNMGQTMMMEAKRRGEEEDAAAKALKSAKD